MTDTASINLRDGPVVFVTRAQLARLIRECKNPLHVFATTSGPCVQQPRGQPLTEAFTLLLKWEEEEKRLNGANDATTESVQG